VGRGLRRVGALTAVAAVSVAGCRSEKTFTAAEFVGKVEEQGVSLHLGRRLATQSGADQLYAITLPRLPGEPASSTGEEGGRGPNGSVYVYDDANGAGEELSACRASQGLLCFRAANIVVVLDQDTGGIAARQLGVAIMRLGS
jgi:hypothetical protein